jgi:phosphatidylglycerol---prolipoprotein diacylglyceryl transferase
MTLTFALDPVIAQLGPFQLGWHGIFTAIAVLVAVWLAGRLALQCGIPTEVVYAIAGWGVVGGLIGARLFHVADHLSYYQQNPLLIPAIWEGGIAVYGAFIGGLVGGSIAAWRSHLDPWPLLDIAAPTMLVGQGIGRLGCLCNGDAWGRDATGCPFCLAIRYTNQNDLLPANLRGVPTYAYPLYELAAEALLLATLWLFRDRLRQRPGLTFLVGSIGYGIIRFGLTFYRQEVVVLWGLQEAQVIAAITGLVALGFLIWRMTRLTAGASPASAA